MSRVAVLGGTGEVGREIVRALIDQGSQSDWPSEVTLYLRRPLSMEEIYRDQFTPEKNDFFREHVTQTLIDYESPPKDFMENIDVVLCALGTTMGKAKSVEEFKKVDYGYVAMSAERAKRNGCKRFIHCSSTMSNAKSWYPYLVVKALTEQEIAKQEFDYAAMARPMVLLCNRLEKRSGLESIAVNTMKIMDRWNLFSIKTSDVANAMVYSARMGKTKLPTKDLNPTTQVFEHNQLLKLSKLAGK